MCRGSETALRDQQEERGPVWFWERPKDQKALDRMQAKRGNSVEIGREQGG